MTAVAFELREKYAEKFSGGTVSPGGKTFNVASSLEEGGGKIVVDDAVDPALVDALDGFPALKRAGVEETDTPVDQLEILTVAELRDTATRLGVSPEGRSKQAYIEAIRAAQSGQEGAE